MRFWKQFKKGSANFFTYTRQHKKIILSRLKMLLSICIVYYAVTWFTGCPIKYLTGISCPGCGMTRAWLSLLHFDFAGAFACHPLFWTLPFILLVLLLDEAPDIRRYRWAVILGGCLYIGVYLIRIIFFPDSIVAFQPKDGFIYRHIISVLTSILGNVMM